EVSEQLAVVLQHVGDDGVVYETALDHLARVDVEVGAHVAAGAPLGLSGNSGCTSGPHLHLTVYRADGGDAGARRVPVDPFGWEGDRPDPWGAATGAPSAWLWREAPAI